MTTTLTKVCGGNEEQKLKFYKKLAACIEGHIDQESEEKLGMLAWEHGFHSCLDMFVRAINRGEISIETMNDDGTFGVFIPHDKDS